MELADLVDHFPEEVGRVVRAVYSGPDWLPAPGRVAVATGFVKASCYPGDSTRLILLGMSSREILHIMVVPPDSSPDFARVAMELAAKPAQSDSVGATLSVAREAGPWRT